MNIQQLRMVESTIQNRFNLTEAAKALFTTQPALSRGILDLESELGRQLFVRHGKRLTGLTDEGQAFMMANKKILFELGNIKNMSSDWKAEDQGRLVIATTHTQARYTLPKALSRFREKYPKVQLVIRQGNPSQIAEFLRRGEARYAIATEGLQGINGFRVLPFFQWEHVVLFPKKHALAAFLKSGKKTDKKARKIAIKELAEYPLILFDKAFAGRSRIDDAFEKAHLSQKVVLEASDADVIKTYVRHKMGVGILPNIAFDATVDKGLVAISAGHLFGDNVTWLAYMQDQYLRKFEQAFIHICNPKLSQEAL